MHTRAQTNNAHNNFLNPPLPLPRRPLPPPPQLASANRLFFEVHPSSLPRRAAVARAGAVNVPLLRRSDLK